MGILKYLWQLPQHLVALIYLLWLKIDSSVIGKRKEKKYTVYVKDTPGSVTLGKYIFLYENAKEGILQHESGHVRQSLYLGPLYLFIIGIPSAFWAFTHESICPDKSYYWFYTEVWANRLGGVDLK